MSYDLNFQPEVINSLIGGKAVVEAVRLTVKNKDEANAYLKTYGYDVSVDEDRQRLWQLHARAVTYLKTQLLVDGETFPSELSDPKMLDDISNLLLLASHKTEDNPLTKWACALLRVMHVVAQLQNDLFNHFSLEIQEEIFKPYRQFVHKDPEKGIFLTAGENGEKIPLQKFDIKPFKDSDSSITKLLAKPDEVAFGLLDKIGVRFVTSTLFDVFRVIRFLTVNHVVSTANVIPSQSNNTLYPLNLFVEVIDQLSGQNLSAEEIDKRLLECLEKQSARARFVEKNNVFTSRDYRFIKFITRQLVRVSHLETQKSFSFFYPYEVQILDYNHYIRSLSGPASHDEYKARQKARARERVLV